jgi:hypothetical protein
MLPRFHPLADAAAPAAQRKINKLLLLLLLVVVLLLLLLLLLLQMTTMEYLTAGQTWCPGRTWALLAVQR